MLGDAVSFIVGGFMSCCKPTTWAAEQPGAYKQIPIIVSTTLHPIRLIGFESLKPVIKGEYGAKKKHERESYKLEGSIGHA